MGAAGLRPPEGERGVVPRVRDRGRVGCSALPLASSLGPAPMEKLPPQPVREGNEGSRARLGLAPG